MPDEALKQYITARKWDVQQARATFFFVWYVFSAYLESESLHGVDWSQFFSYYKDKNFFQYVEEEKVLALTKYLFKRYNDDPKSLDETITKHVDLTGQLFALGESYGDLRARSLSDLARLFERHTAIANSWWRYGILLEDKGRIIQEAVAPHFSLANKLTMEDAQEMVAILSAPDHPTIFTSEHLSLLELGDYLVRRNLSAAVMNDQVDIIMADSGFSSLYEEYQRKYFWMLSDLYKYVPFTPQALIRKLRDEVLSHRAENAAAVKKELVKSRAKLISDQRQWRRKFPLTAVDKKYLYFASRIIEWMDERKVGMMTDIYYLTRLLEEIGRRFDRSYEEISLYSPPEIGQMLTGKFEPNSELESQREAGVMMVWKKGSVPALYYGDEGVQLFHIFNDLFLPKPGSLIKGVVASAAAKDTVDGVVNVILDPEVQDFEAGAILVTSMTRVEFLPLMRKALAVITDEGGIACHAAVVSRELGIPCIIATKKATKALKNRQRVRLNLKSGEIISIES